MSMKNTLIAGLFGLYTAFAPVSASAEPPVQRTGSVTVIPAGGSVAPSADQLRKANQRATRALRKAKKVTTDLTALTTDYNALKTQFEQYRTSNPALSESDRLSLVELTTALSGDFTNLTGLKSKIDTECSAYIVAASTYAAGLTGTATDGSDSLTAKIKAIQDNADLNITQRTDKIKTLMAERAESETAMTDADTKCTAATNAYTAALTEFRTRLSRNLSETEADKRKRINSLSLTNIDRSLGIAPILGYEWNGSHAFFAGGKLCYNIAAGENSLVPVCISGGAFVGSDYRSTSNEDGEPSTDDVGFGYQNQSTLLKSIEDRVQQYGKIGFRVETPKLTLGSDFTGHLAVNLDAYFGDKRTTITTTNNSQLFFDGNPSGDLHVVSNDESSRRTVYSFVPTAGLTLCYNTSGDDSVCLDVAGGINTNSGKGIFRTTLEYNF